MAGYRKEHNAFNLSLACFNNSIYYPNLFLIFLHIFLFEECWEWNILCFRISGWVFLAAVGSAQL